MNEGAGENSSVLDPATLAQLEKVGGDELLRRLFEMFLELNPAKVSAIQQGLKGRDFDTIRRASHSLRSSAGNVGAQRLFELASQVETAALAEDHPMLEQLSLQVAETFRAVELSIRQRLGEGIR